jgi:hypothetical protein
MVMTVTQAQALSLVLLLSPVVLVAAVVERQAAAVVA